MDFMKFNLGEYDLGQLCPSPLENHQLEISVGKYGLVLCTDKSVSEFHPYYIRIKVGRGPGT